MPKGLDAAPAAIFVATVLFVLGDGGWLTIGARAHQGARSGQRGTAGKTVWHFSNASK
jgi:hypothetical protein